MKVLAGLVPKFWFSFNLLRSLSLIVNWAVTAPVAITLPHSERVRDSEGVAEAWLMILNRVQVVLAASMEETPATFKTKLP